MTSQDDADILVQHLTGQDGRIREVSAFKINELIKTHADYFQKQEIILTFLKGITDVNPTVCRFIIDALLFINDKKIVIDYLLEQTRQLFVSINKAEKGVKKHILNKQIFKLYWSLEALVVYLYKENKFIAISDIEDILDEGVNFEEYTIREKIHKLLYCFKSADCEKYIKKLENDENFYVRIGGKRELE